MKKAPVRLSIRKLLIAMLAAGPVAVLPSPLLAAVPLGGTNTAGSTAPFTVVSGNVVWSGSGSVSTNTGTIATDRGTLLTITSTTNNAIISWNPGAFNIAADADTAVAAPGNQTETFNFQVPNGSGILNRVGYSVAATQAAGLPQFQRDDAIINGNLQSNGRVFILANGNITIGAGAQISTQGLFLSTLAETDNFNFSALGNLSLTGSATGNISIGGTGTQVGVVGSLGAWAGNVSVNNLSVTGDLIVNTRNSTQALSITGADGATAVTGNLSLTTNNGTIGQGTTALTVGGNTTLSTNGTAAVTLNSTGNNFQTVTANVGGLTIRDTNDIVLGNSTIGAGGLAVTATNNITTSGTVTVATGGNVTLSSTGVGLINYVNNSTVGNVLVANTTSGNITVNSTGTVTIAGAGVVAGGAASQSAITTNGALNLNGPVSAGANAVFLTGTSISANASGAVTTTAGAVFNATAGSVVLGTVTANEIRVSAPAGSISQLASTVITTATGSTSSFTSSPTGSITLTNNNLLGAPAAGLATGSINLTGGSASITNNNAVTIGESTLNGSLTINTVNAGAAGNVVLGTGFGTAGVGTRVAGTLTITTNGASVTDNDYAPYQIGGAITVNSAVGTAAGADVVFDAANAGFGNPPVSLGQININAGTGGNATVVETTTVNLGTITAGRIQANSTGGDIIQTGVLTSTGARDQNRFAVSNNTVNRIVLDNPGNSFATTGLADGNNGSVVVIGGNNNILTATGNIRLDNRTNTSGGNFTVNATGNIVVVGGNYRDVFLNATDSVHFIGRNDQTTNSARMTVTAGSSNATSISNGAGAQLTTDNRAFTNNGTLTLTTPGGVQLVHGANTLNVVNFAGVAGDAYVYARSNITVTGNSASNVTVAAGTVNPTQADVGRQYNVTLGDIRGFGNLTAYALNGVTANTALGVFPAPGAFTGLSGNIVQQNATTSVSITGNTTLVTFGGDVRLTNNNNSFGRVNVATGGTPTTVGTQGNISITEYDTLRLGNILTNGTANLTSRFGSIIEDTPGSNIIVRGGLTLNAPNGSVLLGNATGLTTGDITGLAINAAGAASISTVGANIVLGAIKANALTVTANNITQNAALDVFGSASFNATNSINLTNAGNNFGPVTLISQTANQSISITENNTLNLRSVTMPGGAGTSNGTFTGNSVNGDIMDSGLGFVRLGGNHTAPNVGNPGSGLVTLTAANGNIVINDATSDIVTSGGVAFNARNVELSVLGTPGGTLALGSNATASAVTGNLVVSSAQGNIGSVGAFSVGGLASFTTGLGNITLDQANLRFGQLAFSGNTVRIAEAGSMDILSTSRASGPVQLVSGGSIVIVPVGNQTATFGSTVALQAAGDIILRNMQALGTVSLSHTGTANLSALRVTDLLGNPQYVDLGTGPFVPPTP